MGDVVCFTEIDFTVFYFYGKVMPEKQTKAHILNVAVVVS